MSFRTVSRVSILSRAVGEGSILFVPRGIPQIGYLRPSNLAQPVEFARLTGKVLETRVGGRFRYERTGQQGPWEVLELGHSVDRYPPARFQDVVRGKGPQWPAADDSKSLTRAEQLYDLRLSQGHGFARFAWRWWMIVRADLRKLLLWRRERGEDRWVILGREFDSPVVELSREHPVAFNPLGDGLRFAFQERQWDPFRRLSAGLWILFDSQNRELTKGDPLRWMAVARSDEGHWRQLIPAGRSDETKVPEPVSLSERPWAASRGSAVSYRGPNGRNYPGLRHTISVADGTVVQMTIPDTRSRAYEQRRQGRRFPSVERLAQIYSRIPRPFLGGRRPIVHVHSTGLGTQYGALEHGVTHLYPPSFGRELAATVFHEELGHRAAPQGKAFEALWVSAMIADGTILYDKAQNPEEDLAQAVERYFEKRDMKRHPNRMAILDWVFRRAGNWKTPWSQQEIRRLLRWFRPQGPYLTMRGASPLD